MTERGHPFLLALQLSWDGVVLHSLDHPVDGTTPASARLACPARGWTAKIRNGGIPLQSPAGTLPEYGQHYGLGPLYLPILVEPRGTG